MCKNVKIILIPRIGKSFENYLCGFHYRFKKGYYKMQIIYPTPKKKILFPVYVPGILP